MRTGDVVKHGGSGETWVLAYARPERDEVSPCGWPESIAKMSDCTLVEAATDEKHQRLVADIRKIPWPDCRRRAIDELYPEGTC